jgi:DNA-binding transcriptional MerR regulator
MTPSGQPRSWTVGELAKHTGLTVRTLHHYDELGLLSPRERTQAGHRRYGDDDVERLYRIVALRRLGLSLAAVSASLDGDAGELEAVVRRQLEALDERLEIERRLRGLLSGVLDALGRAERPSVDDVLQTIEVTQMIEKHYTPDQLVRLSERREAMGDDAIHAVEREWSEIFATLRREMEGGTDPADPRLDPLRARMGELVAMFHGGDESIKASMTAMWAKEDPVELSRGALDHELAGYMRRVQAAGETRG